MTDSSIVLTDVHLHYAATAFKERSLKSLLAGVLSTRSRPPAVTDIHALRGITASIASGERVGLIGHNGAGKSTLLKVVAGLYPISSGICRVQGQVRSLFDLSLGFEPDATGRENILYRGLLLGVTPAVMRKKEAEIVEFAGLDEFIDYPIRTYSAGMQVRLAFAISTSIDGDILILDEVVGAGDAAFMAKAKSRIQSMVNQASIVLLASHDVNSLINICGRVLVLDHGGIVFDGKPEESIDWYTNLVKNKGMASASCEKMDERAP